MDANDGRGACPEQEVFLEDYLAGELSSPEAERVQAHLKNCPACAGALEEARASAPLLRALDEPAADSGPLFATRVMAAIREEESRRSLVSAFWQPLEILAWRLSLTAAVALAFLVGYGVRSDVGPAAEVQQVSTSGQADGRALFPEPAQQPSSEDEVLLTIVEKNHGN